ncbi:LysR family transcriptional regulator [Erwinia mallotivora]|uniref:LysR family transcriptional regulator n=1 Tax=Erwinia mallotivora TaxID=69222 RepID=UPI0021BE0CC4|nr:LysR family transcriptional regulator [Erwinia mallotivora]
MHKTTLEQWSLLSEVVAQGSFARAAEVTHRSQSSVSYNLAILQERLGVTLLEPQGRRTVLTPAGELLLAQVRPLLATFHSVEAWASSVREGFRTRLDLLVDTIFPRSILFSVLRRFQQIHPHTQINLSEVLESHANDSSDADVMIVTRRQDLTGRGEWLMNVNFVAVAQRDHPLLQQDGPIHEELLAQYPLIRIADRKEIAHGSGESWSFSTIEAAIEAVMHQVGYGWLPAERISNELTSGQLKRLPLQSGVLRATPLHLLVKKDLITLDPQMLTLLDLFRETVKENGD